MKILIKDFDPADLPVTEEDPTEVINDIQVDFYLDEVTHGGANWNTDSAYSHSQRGTTNVGGRESSTDEGIDRSRL